MSEDELEALQEAAREHGSIQAALVFYRRELRLAELALEAKDRYTERLENLLKERP